MQSLYWGNLYGKHKTGVSDKGGTQQAHVICWGCLELLFMEAILQTKPAPMWHGSTLRVLDSLGLAVNKIKN